LRNKTLYDANTIARRARRSKSHCLW
jgi:hypothetical protein